MSAAAQTAPQKKGHAPTPWPGVLRVALIATVIVTLIVLAFTWPTKTQETKDLPISVAGSEQMVQQFEDKINDAQPGAFDFHHAKDKAEAERQIKEQETVGGIVFGKDQKTAPEVLSAPAAGNIPNQVMKGMAQKLQDQIQQGIQAKVDGVQQQVQQAQAAGHQPSAQQMGQLMGMQKAVAQTKVKVTEVVPLSDDDPNGAGFAAASFPLVLGGILGGVLINSLMHGLWRRLVAAAVYGAVAGLALTLILHTWFGFVQGDFVVDWMVFILSVLGTTSLILGCTAMVGPAGIGIGAVITMFLGNPLSGAQTPWQFYPHPWGWIGQHLVPGAAQRLLRTESFFPDSSGTEQWWTLIFWALLGVALTIVGYLVHHHGKTHDTVEPEQSDRGLDYSQDGAALQSAGTSTTESSAEKTSAAGPERNAAEHTEHRAGQEEAHGTSSTTKYVPRHHRG